MMLKNESLKIMFILLFHQLICMKDNYFINLNMMPKNRANWAAYRFDNALVISSLFNFWTWVIIWILSHESTFILWNDKTLAMHKCWSWWKCIKFFLSSCSCYLIYLHGTFWISSARFTHSIFLATQNIFYLHCKTLK